MASYSIFIQLECERVCYQKRWKVTSYEMLLLLIAGCRCRRHRTLSLTLFIVKCKIYTLSHTHARTLSAPTLFPARQQQRRIFSPAQNNNKLPRLCQKERRILGKLLPLAFYAHYFRTWIAAVAYGDELGRNWLTDAHFEPRRQKLIKFLLVRAGARG